MCFLSVILRRRTKLTKVVESQCLNNLRYEEKSQIDRVFFKNTVSILKQVSVVNVLFLEKRDSNYWWDGGPEQDVLPNIISSMSALFHKNDLWFPALTETRGIIDQIA